MEEAGEENIFLGSHPAFSDSGGHQETTGDFRVCTSEPVAGGTAGHSLSTTGEARWGHLEATGRVRVPHLWGDLPL